MKIAEVLKESKSDDWDEEEELPGDPDQDKIPHIVFQLLKTFDAGGKYPITFKDGTKSTIHMDDIQAFLHKYIDLKAADKEEMQRLAAQSEDAFYDAIQGSQRTPEPRSLRSVPPIPIRKKKKK